MRGRGSVSRASRREPAPPPRELGQAAGGLLLHRRGGTASSAPPEEQGGLLGADGPEGAGGGQQPLQVGKGKPDPRRLAPAGKDQHPAGVGIGFDLQGPLRRQAGTEKGVPGQGEGQLPGQAFGGEAMLFQVAGVSTARRRRHRWAGWSWRFLLALRGADTVSIIRVSAGTWIAVMIGETVKSTRHGRVLAG
jgi:hypothetical protein